MVQRLWGCYSVRDHLEPRAFVADLLLYDRLVVPVPTDDDRDRWINKRWEPDRQEALLAIAGPFIERIPWDADLRAVFGEQWPQEGVASEFAIARDNLAAGHQDPFQMTRRMLIERISGDVLPALRAGDGIQAVTVYAAPDRFDIRWRVKQSFPFIGKTVEVTPGRAREVREPARAGVQQRARLVVMRLAVPDDGQTDEDVLRRTVDLISREDVSRSRAAFQALVSRFHEQELPMRDETLVGEIDDLLGEYNRVLAKHTKAQRAKVALQMATAAEGALAILAPFAGVATGPTAALGEAVIERRWGSDVRPEAGAVALLAEAQNALR